MRGVEEPVSSVLLLAASRPVIDSLGMLVHMHESRWRWPLPAQTSVNPL